MQFIDELWTLSREIVSMSMLLESAEKFDKNFRVVFSPAHRIKSDGGQLWILIVTEKLRAFWERYHTFSSCELPTAILAQFHSASHSPSSLFRPCQHNAVLEDLVIQYPKDVLSASRYFFSFNISNSAPENQAKFTTRWLLSLRKSLMLDEKKFNYFYCSYPRGEKQKGNMMTIMRW